MPHQHFQAKHSFAPKSPHKSHLTIHSLHFYANHSIGFLFFKLRSNTYDSIVRHRYLNSVIYEEEEEKKSKTNK